MLDIKFIRQNKDAVKHTCDRKRITADLDELLRLDDERKLLQRQVDELNHSQKTLSKQIGGLKAQNLDTKELFEKIAQISQKIKEQESVLNALNESCFNMLIQIPNITHDSVPDGKNETDNKLIRKWGKEPEYDFKPLPHWDIGEALGILDLKRSAKISGSGFPLFMGAGARLERALINFFLDVHTNEHTYTEVFAPFVVNRKSMFSTGQIPKLESDMYRIEQDDLFLIPTAEVPLTNIYRDEILEEKDLPVYVTGYTPCFRREAGSYGKDTRGIIRVHQFNKVELVKFVKPETSYEEHEKLLADAEDILQRLGLHYQIKLLCIGDMSFSAAKCYDIEVWAPAQGKYLEVSSCSNFTDFQARRGNIKFRDKEGRTQFVHTLNASGLALPRTVIAILETYQTKEGVVRVPDALVPYMGGLKEIRK